MENFGQRLATERSRTSLIRSKVERQGNSSRDWLQTQFEQLDSPQAQKLGGPKNWDHRKKEENPIPADMHVLQQNMKSN